MTSEIHTRGTFSAKEDAYGQHGPKAVYPGYQRSASRTLAIYSFKEHDVLIPMTVLEELDNIKDRHKDVSRDARIAIRALEDVFRDATPSR